MIWPNKQLHMQYTLKCVLLINREMLIRSDPPRHFDRLGAVEVHLGHHPHVAGTPVLVTPLPRGPTDNTAAGRSVVQ